MEKELNMKTINNYILSKIKNKTNITEKLKINKSNLKKGTEVTLFPKDIDELNEMISDEIYKNGYKCNLNHIDTSKITDMNNLFYFTEFNGDISEWDVSNVKNMEAMFSKSKFNNSICRWNVLNVKNMVSIFRLTPFNQDLSTWTIHINTERVYWFDRCPIERNLDFYPIRI